MFIAMNRFKVVKGEEKAFEDMWLNRESHLDTVPGFVEFHMLKGPERDDHTLYSSHTVWSDRDSFGAWTTSQQFRSAHGGVDAADVPRPPRVRRLRGDPDDRERPARRGGVICSRAAGMPASTVDGAEPIGTVKR